MRSKFLTTILTLSLVGIVPAVAAEPAAEVTSEQVRRAIERGVRYLRDKENAGRWPEEITLRPLAPGSTCLALLALLNAGVKPDDPIIDRGLDYLRTLEPTYTYIVGLQTMVFAEAGRKADRERVQKNVDWLVASRIMSGGRLMGWTYEGDRRVEGLGDNSNTQYALLGLHAGHVAGAQIQREVWESIRDYYIRTQHPQGSWGYSTPGRDAPRFTMTTAGLCGLVIAGMDLNAGREVFQADGGVRNCGVYQENRPIARALSWIGSSRRFDIENTPHVFYNLYGIERAGRLSGLRFFGDHDWYREGCKYLVRTQKAEDGSWYIAGRPYDSWPVISTSFALLFLSKGLTPVLISKLVHGPIDNLGSDWNNDRNDIRHLVEYASKEVFKNQPLAWQIFDARRAEVRNNDDLRRLVGDLLQSPIVYFNGHNAPVFTENEKKLLQQYVEQGGFILAEACCGRREFDDGFRKLMRELFPPPLQLKRLPPEHPIWQAHAKIPPTEFPQGLWGIEMGCKTVVVYSPQDLSCHWEGNRLDDGPGRLAFRLGGNLIAYATGLELPQDRLTKVEVIDQEPGSVKVKRGYLKVAQLRHEGDWQPAPRAMSNLMDHLRKKAQLDVALQTEALRPSHPDLVDFKFLYMHGRSGFSFDSKDLDKLRFNLETGGLLLADACCGKAAFDTAFRAFAAQLFPDKKLEPIPLSDELFGKELTGTPLTTVRCRQERADGSGPEAEFREVAPYLEGIRHDNRWVVIYSKYDLGCALEKHQSTDCLGHDHESALKIGTAVVLYALKR